MSATLADGRGAALHQPVLVTLVHTRSEGMGRPVCMAWDRDAGDWTDGACRVVTYNRYRFYFLKMQVKINNFRDFNLFYLVGSFS